MNYRLLKMIGFIFISSCTGRSPAGKKDALSNKADTNGKAIMETVSPDSTPKNSGTTGETEKGNTSLTSDTTWYPFSDSAYRLQVHIFNTNASQEDGINSVITFSHVKDGRIKQIFQDSFYCMDNYMLQQDINNDHVEDILVFCYSGARANPSYHLFLADTIRHKLTYVKGFEELPNPSLDTQYNVIVSLALSGTNDYRFYHINSRNKLINLGHGYEERADDSTQYERAIRGIIRDRQTREALNAAK
jgi:hypothetical protein